MSDINVIVAIRGLREEEITLRPYQASVAPHLASGRDRLRYWRLELNEEIDIVIGHASEQLAQDLAAMRKLAATAAQAAGQLQAALEHAGQEDGGA